MEILKCINSLLTPYMEILKLIISLLAPIIVLILGLKLSKKLEKNKLGVLKEKEWQVKWSDLFFNEAVEFNNNISSIVTTLFSLQKSEPNSEKQKELYTKVLNIQNKIRIIEWNIQNFSQFAIIHNSKLKEKQSELISKLEEVGNNKKVDLEEIRHLQFEYNQIVRIVHNEILNNTK